MPSGRRAAEGVLMQRTPPSFLRRLDVSISLSAPKDGSVAPTVFSNVRHFGAGGSEEVEPKDVGRNQAQFTGLVAALDWENMQHRLVAPRLSHSRTIPVTDFGDRVGSIQPVVRPPRMTAFCALRGTPEST